MSAYLPSSLDVLLRLGALEALVLLFGLVWPRLASPWARVPAWAAVVGGILAAHWLTSLEGGGLRMLAICAVTLTSMKGVVAVEAKLAHGVLLAPHRWLLFTAWPGMRPQAFAAPRRPLDGIKQLVWKGISRLVLGAAVVLLARLAWSTTGSRVLATALLLPGVSLVFHFGAFNLGAAFYRALGFEVDALFVAPLLSKSLDEFWSRRWNLAFSDMSRFAVYRPLVPRAGKTPATLAAFVFSGLLHEIAISLPSRAGYGLPLLYFAIHGALMLIERALAKRGRPIDAHPILSRVWTIGWLAVPMPILFHPWFLERVVWPMIGIA